MSDTNQQSAKDQGGNTSTGFVFSPELMKPAEPFMDHGAQCLMLPPDWSAHDARDYFRFQAHPRGEFVVQSTETLKQIIQRFAPDPERAVGYLTTDTIEGIGRNSSGCLSVILDHGNAAAIGTYEYKARMLLQAGGPLRKLMGFYSSGGNHKRLVEFLDALLLFLVKPDASVILDSLHKISLTKEVKFQRAEDLATGDVAFSFETITGQSTASGRVRLPDSLEFSIPVFRGVRTQWLVKFGLRYTLRDESVTFNLYHPDLQDSFENDFMPRMLAELQQDLAPSQVIHGMFTPAARD
jgi:uncharacterized protein YfdQ (DUF2303 family)